MLVYNQLGIAVDLEGRPVGEMNKRKTVSVGFDSVSFANKTVEMRGGQMLVPALNSD